MKLTFRQFVDICPQGYSDWTVCWWWDWDEGIRWNCSAYVMHSPLTDEQKAKLKQYENVKLTVGRRKRGPKTSYDLDLVIIGNSTSEIH